jgi:hypothetical protein
LEKHELYKEVAGQEEKFVLNCGFWRVSKSVPVIIITKRRQEKNGKPSFIKSQTA